MPRHDCWWWEEDLKIFPTYSTRVVRIAEVVVALCVSLSHIHVCRVEVICYRFASIWHNSTYDVERGWYCSDWNEGQCRQHTNVQGELCISLVDGFNPNSLTLRSTDWQR